MNVKGKKLKSEEACGARREVRWLFSYYPVFTTKDYQFRLLCSAGQGHIQGLPHFNGKTRRAGFAYHNGQAGPGCLLHQFVAYSGRENHHYGIS